jgi:hypothetical protein
MKFSQVEFISVISTLLWRSRVEAVLPIRMYETLKAKGKDDKELKVYAKARLQEILDDSDVRITTTMVRPQEARLRWHKASSPS